MAQLHPRRIHRFSERFRVDPGKRVRLPRDFDPGKAIADVSKAELKHLLGIGVDHLAEFQARYPDVVVELHCDNRFVDLVAAGFDAGRTTAELAKLHDRSRAAIEARLLKLGKIDVSALTVQLRYRGAQTES